MTWRRVNINHHLVLRNLKQYLSYICILYFFITELTNDKELKCNGTSSAVPDLDAIPLPEITTKLSQNEKTSLRYLLRQMDVIKDTIRGSFPDVKLKTIYVVFTLLYMHYINANTIHSRILFLAMHVHVLCSLPGPY